FPVYIIYLYIRIILTVYTVLNVIVRYITDICEYILSGDISIVISVGVYKDIYNIPTKQICIRVKWRDPPARPHDDRSASDRLANDGRDKTVQDFAYVLLRMQVFAY